MRSCNLSPEPSKQSGQGSLGPKLKIAMRGLGSQSHCLLVLREVTCGVEGEAVLDFRPSRFPDGPMSSPSLRRLDSGHTFICLPQTPSCGRRGLQ